MNPTMKESDEAGDSLQQLHKETDGEITVTSAHPIADKTSHKENPSKVVPEATNNESASRKRKRILASDKSDNNNTTCNNINEILNESSTIEDLASIDASTYIAWVNRQSCSLPNVFTANQDQTTIIPTPRILEPIDGSAATLKVFFSEQMGILPPPTLCHLPPGDHLEENESLVDCSEWITATIANFSELRSYLEKVHSQVNPRQQHSNRRIAVPRMKDRGAWHVFCLGHEEAHGNVGGHYEAWDGESDEDKCGVDDDDNLTDEFTNHTPGVESTHVENDGGNTNSLEKDEDFTIQNEPHQEGIQLYNPDLVPPKGYPPTLSLLLQFDQVLTRVLFHHHIIFLCEWQFPLTRNRAAWIYALLARMEKPWHREECSAVRGLLRECCARRGALILPDVECKPNTSSEFLALDIDRIEEKTIPSPGGGDTKEWVSLALLNTLIAISGLYYEQGSSAGGDSRAALFSIRE